MTAVPKSLTVVEFLDWAERQETGRYELFRGVIHAQAAQRAAHVRGKQSIFAAFRAAISKAGLPCEAFIDGIAVQISSDTTFIPDMFVNCGPPMPGDARIASNPVVVVEVLSPSSQRVDTAIKLVEYFKIASIHHYLVVDTDNRVVTHHRRSENLEPASLRLATGALELTPPGVTVTVADLLAAD